MIQVYVAVRARRQVTIPSAALDALGVCEDEWLRLTVVEPGRALLERVPDTAEPIGIAPASACGAASRADATGGR